MQVTRLPNFQACNVEVQTAGSMGAKKGTSLPEHWLYRPWRTGTETAIPDVVAGLPRSQLGPVRASLSAGGG